MPNPRVSLLFPGQGAQYVGMGKSFYEGCPVAREVFDHANDILGFHLTDVIFTGPESTLVQTKMAQPAIFVTSYAIFQSIRHQFSLPAPVCAAGLSLGEYSALAAAGAISFESALPLVNLRGRLMHEACEQAKGTMLVIMGLPDDQVRHMVDQLHMPDDLWCANFNCPGQVVISGTLRGIEAAQKAAHECGAKRALPLNVHGAFHSGLMKTAQRGLETALNEVHFSMPETHVAMNVTGHYADSVEQIRSLLVQQVTSSVLWHACVTTCANDELSCFLEIGCGKTLTGLNKRIGVSVPTIAIETIDDLKSLEPLLA